MSSTHVFKLVSGVECEVKEMTGKHQELMTIQSSKPHTERLNELLKDLIVRVGSQTNITADFVKEMLAVDKKKALIEIRQFSFGFPTDFSFHFSYTDNGRQKSVVETIEFLDGGKFPETPLKIQADKNEETFSEATFSEYSEVIEHKNIFITLPRSGKKVRFTMLDNRGEEIASRTPKKDRSSNTLIKMRQPVYFETSSSGNEVPVQLDLNKLSLVDIEHLRKVIKEVEGNIHTEISFDHPTENRTEVVDLTSITAFFFPSEAI